jgi:sn-glycerol 3-phosphate transport system permease protein
MAEANMTQDLPAVRPKQAHVVSQWAGQRRTPLAQFFGYFGLILVTLVIGVPVYWMIIGAFKENREIYQIPPTWFPMDPTFENFPEAWSSAPFGRYYINTFITTLFGSGFEIFFAATSAYAFVFLRFPKRDWLFLVLLAALMVPGQVTILPNYLTIARLGWINTYQGIIVPGASVAYGTFLLRQYYRTLPLDIMDAAKVDGAGHLRTMASIVVPLAKPAIISFGLLSVVAKWNDFLWPLLVTNTRDMRVLPIGIYWLMVEEGSIEWGPVMAGTIFVVLPVLIVFLYAQQYIVEGIAAGAVKG